MNFLAIIGSERVLEEFCFRERRFIYLFSFKKQNAILRAKYMISTPLMIENPVRSPIVPPIADNMSTNLAFLS